MLVHKSGKLHRAPHLEPRLLCLHQENIAAILRLQCGALDEAISILWVEALDRAYEPVAQRRVLAFAFAVSRIALGTVADGHIAFALIALGTIGDGHVAFAALHAAAKLPAAFAPARLHVVRLGLTSLVEHDREIHWHAD
eukprot:CAMPEP_0198593494 /NCGR_PEP_ID=MMETSP1462-20131121/139470_1 /TAXON_ID=1333877 /ORGANISM="Brandtodinium nutriculum, Strain RCC3387" /LENGTH=139 /DNA_ID=CAMNT_0044325097 /DNA_START=56 /DNA_END=475 /DNA_ORIENTATION=+